MNPLSWLRSLCSASPKRSGRLPLRSAVRRPLFVEPLEERALMNASLSISNAFGSEGGYAQFLVTLSGPVEQTVTVKYETAPGSANKADYKSEVGTLTFAPGETVKYIYIQVLEDSKLENEEQFSVNLFEAVNAELADSLGIGTILDNDTKNDDNDTKNDPSCNGAKRSRSREC